jgi:hypothetical protein
VELTRFSLLAGGGDTDMQTEGTTKSWRSQPIDKTSSVINKAKAISAEHLVKNFKNKLE